MNEVRINLTLQGDELKKTFTRILNETLNDKAIKRTLRDEVAKWGEEYFGKVGGIGQYLETIQKLSDEAFDLGELEKSNAVLGITANLLKQIESEILNFGQLSFSDVLTGLTTLVKLMNEAKGIMGGLAGNQEAGASIDDKAFDTESRRQIDVIDEKIALAERRKKFWENYKNGKLSIKNLSKDQQLINSKSSVKDVQDYVREAQTLYEDAQEKLDALSLTQEKDKLGDEYFNAVMAGASEDEEKRLYEAYNTKLQEWKKLAEYQEREKANKIYSERVVVADDWAKKHNESGDRLAEGWDTIVASAKETLSQIVEAKGIQEKIANELKELQEQRKIALAQTVAIGITNAEDLPPEPKTASSKKGSEDDSSKDKKPEKEQKSAPQDIKDEEKEVDEKAKAQEKLLKRLDTKQADLDESYDKAINSVQNTNAPKIETPEVIDDISIETDEQKKRLLEIYNKIQDLKLLKDKDTDEYKKVWGDSWKELSELTGETIDQDTLSSKLSAAVWFPKKAVGGFPTGVESRYSKGEKSNLDAVEKYLEYLTFKGELESAIDAGVLDSVEDFRYSPSAAPSKISGDELKKRIRLSITSSNVLEAIETQIANALGLLPTQVVEEVAQEAIPQAASTIPSDSKPSASSSGASSTPPSTPSVSIPNGGGGPSSPPNTVYVNVVYKKTRDQLAAEILELLDHLQSVLDKTPLKFAFEDPNGAEGGTLPQIFKALSKNTSHTITIEVNKTSINKLSAAYHNITNLANVMRDALVLLDEADKETLQAFGASLPTSTVAAFDDEQLQSLIDKLSGLFESEDGVNYFNTLNESVKALTKSLDGILQKFQEFSMQASTAEEQVQDVINTPINPRTDSDAADSLWFDVQNASHKLFKKSSHKDAIGDVSQYKLIDQESDAYKKLSEVLFELYDRYKALGGVRNLSEVVEDEWYSLNDRVKAPGSADLNKLEQDYADRVVRRVNSEGITNQFKELLSILNQLTSKFGELLELYKTINRVADESTLASKWSEVQQNMLRIVNSKGEIDYGKKGFSDLQSSFHKSYREYRDLGGTSDFNDLRMYDTSSLKPNTYESFFRDYNASKYSPTQTPLGGVNDFISRLGDGAKQASSNIELLEGKIKSLEDALQTSNSVSSFFSKLSESLKPAENYFNELADKIKSVGTQQQDVKIDTKAITEPYEKLADVLEGIKKSLNSILELYKTVNGIAPQWELNYQWKNLQDIFNGRGRYNGRGLLNARGAFDPNKNADDFFQMFSKYRRSGGEKGISRLTRGEDNKPITQLAADNLVSRYMEYEARQEAQAQAPISVDLTAIESKIDGIKTLIDTNLQSIKTVVDSIKATIDTLPQSLQNNQQVGQEDVESHVAEISFDAINRSIASLSQQITNELSEKISPVMAEALYQMRLATGELEQQVVGIPKQRRGHSWWEQYLETDYFGKENARLAYREGKYKPYPITLDLGGMGFSGIPSDLQEAQNKIGKNLSKLGIIRLKKIAQEYQSLINTDALEQYYKAIREQDQITRAYLESRFETLRIASDNFLKDMEAGKYAAYNSNGRLKDTGKFWQRPEDATEEIKRLTSSQNIPLKWLPTQGGKFSGNFSKEGVWSGIGVDFTGKATKVTYTYDPFNKDIRELQVDLPKETKKNRRAIDKQKKDFEALKDGFLEDVDKDIAGTKIQNIGRDGQRYSGVLSIVTAKTDELATLRDQIYAALNQDNWDTLNSKIALGVVSKTDAEYKQFQDLLNLLGRFKTKTKEVDSLIGSSDGEGWIKNNKGSVVSEGVGNTPEKIAQAIEETKKKYDGLTGKLSASGQSFSGQYKDAFDQIHDIGIAYDEATESIRVFDQINTKATEDLQKGAQEQYDSVKKVLDETNKLSNQKYGGVNFSDLDSLKAAANAAKPVITQEAETKINEFQQAIADYQDTFNEAAKNNTDWATVAQSQRLGNAEPFTNAYDKLKKLLSLSDGLKKLSETLSKILAPDTGSGWLENDNGTLITLPTDANLSPQKASDTIRDYLENTAGYTSVKSGKHDKQGWHFKGTKNKIEYPITVTYDSNGDLRYLQAELDNTAAKITGLDNLSRQTFDSFSRAIVTLTPLVTVIQSATQAFQNGYNTLNDYDKALTNISYTMTLSKQQLQDLGQATIDMAKDLNLSISDAMSVAQIYANMQTTPEEIVELSRPTAILANLSGQNTETAANYVQSVIEQFGMAEEDAMHIVDVYDTVSANIKMDYAKGIGVIASATEAAGQVAKDAGLSFEQLAAIVAKVAERTREEGSSIGNALKTIITRLSKASQLSGADEVDNETLSKASAALADIGIQVYTSEGEFRSFGTIIGELADKWDSLTDVQQSNLSYQIAA